MSNYLQLLKDPRWQKRRLEILSKSEFRCIQCESEENTLHVHHTIYRTGKTPWDYADDELQVLCVECHGKRHESEDRLKELLAGSDIYKYNNLAGYLVGMQWVDNVAGEIIGADPDFISGFCSALSLRENRVCRFLIENDHVMTYDQMMNNINTFIL